MGYIHIGSITNFEPDDDDNTMYLRSGCGYTISDLVDKIKAKWPDVDPGLITVESEKIHTRCIYYDLHDSGDWDDFLVLRKD